MIGLLVQVTVSWVLLRLAVRENINALGVIPSRERLLNFLFGFTSSAFVCTVYWLAITSLTDNTWIVNAQYSFKNFAGSAGWTVNSVLFEELIFRGALLYILIRFTTEWIGCVVSAIAFGIYHWFSLGVLGNPVQMAFVFVYTATWGLMFAFAFSRTKSLYLPMGLHLGWNLFNTVIFSQGPLGKQFLVIEDNGHRLTGAISFSVQLLQLFALPLIVWLYLKRLSKN